ncbi:hypothetical protein ACJX0J_029170, partial [Zea mays]
AFNLEYLDILHFMRASGVDIAEFRIISLDGNLVGLRLRWIFPNMLIFHSIFGQIQHKLATICLPALFMRLALHKILQLILWKGTSQKIALSHCIHHHATS